MVLALLGLYVAAPLVVYMAWVIDLWAKSYDFPREQRLAKLALTCLVAVAFVSAAGLASRALGVAAAPHRYWIAAVVALPIAVLIWLVHGLDWRSVYAAAAVSPSALLLDRAHRDSAQFVVTALTALVLALAIRRENPRVRLLRYRRTLQHDCSCCGGKQRAVRELSRLGPKGEQAIVRFLDDPGSRDETRARDEWERCCPRPS